MSEVDETGGRKEQGPEGGAWGAIDAQGCARP